MTDLKPIPLTRAARRLPGLSSPLCSGGMAGEAAAGNPPPIYEEPSMGKALQAYRRYRELADRGEFSRVGEVLDENWIENCLGLTGWTLGLDIALANLQAGFGQAFSGLQVTEHEVIEDGDALVIRGENSGTHTGWFLGIGPTGRRVSWEYLDMYRVGADGRLNWHLLATDWNLVRLQLLARAPDLPATPTRRAVQAELARQRDQRQC